MSSVKLLVLCELQTLPSKRLCSTSLLERLLCKSSSNCFHWSRLKLLTIDHCFEGLHLLLRRRHIKNELVIFPGHYLERQSDFWITMTSGHSSLARNLVSAVQTCVDTLTSLTKSRALASLSLICITSYESVCKPFRRIRSAAGASETGAVPS